MSTFDLIVGFVVFLIAAEGLLLYSVVRSTPVPSQRRFGITAVVASMTTIIWVFGIWMNPARGSDHAESMSTNYALAWIHVAVLIGLVTLYSLYAARQRRLRSEETGSAFQGRNMKYGNTPASK